MKVDKYSTLGKFRQSYKTSLKSSPRQEAGKLVDFSMAHAEYLVYVVWKWGRIFYWSGCSKFCNLHESVAFKLVWSEANSEYRVYTIIMWSAIFQKTDNGLIALVIQLVSRPEEINEIKAVVDYRMRDFELRQN